MPRYLTKSCFTLGMECGTKLFYTGKPSEYADNSSGNPFLEALAEGGFQVGELARFYYEGGTLVAEKDQLKATAQTLELLKQDEVILYEAAFLYRDFFIRADIVHKHNGRIDLIEVKAKSFDSIAIPFYGANRQLKSKWLPYFRDVAFQYYVLTHALPGIPITPHLMLADTSTVATVAGLNQFFRLQKEGSRNKVVTRPGLTREMLGEPVLTKENVQNDVDKILGDTYNGQTFEELIETLAVAYKEDRQIFPVLKPACATCQFKASDEELAAGLKSGFRECWSKAAGFGEKEFQKPHMFEVWDFRRKSEMLDSNIYFQEEMDLAHLGIDKSLPASGMSRIERQWLQISKSAAEDFTHELLGVDLRDKMMACLFPLHFIDFETMTAAIPFNKGRRPYEQMAFQFSHHVLHADGTLRHAGQWINTEVGKFPNFDFLRALKAELDKDDGSIFRYSSHENSILYAILLQLKRSEEPDREELIDWIKTIAKPTKNGIERWPVPERNMIDLWEWVKWFYYSPSMKGSNSIKYVLPALLQDSEYLRAKYGRPIYGAEIPSLNFVNHTWLRFDDRGKCQNPYHTLPKIHEDYDDEAVDLMCTDEESGIFDGGAAMTAYARMQFTEMPSQERARMQAALLRYCELDTMAMVMIWEAWREWCG